MSTRDTLRIESCYSVEALMMGGSMDYVRENCVAVIRALASTEQEKK